MLAETAPEASRGIYSTIGLLIAAMAFVSLVLWVLTRPRAEIEAQARLPLQDETQDGADMLEPNTKKGDC